MTAIFRKGRDFEVGAAHFFLSGHQAAEASN